MTEKGYVQVYTGNGKGKTTAAFGLAVRAACAGKNVFIGQFIKGMEYSELKLEDRFSNIKIEQFGMDYFITHSPSDLDKEKADIGFDKIKAILNSDLYDLVILDEMNIALFLNLVDTRELLEVLDKRNKKIEVVITGRSAPDELIEYADLVTEMKEIKHYYQQGVQARLGIEN